MRSDNISVADVEDWHYMQELAVLLLYYFTGISAKLEDSLYLICARKEFPVRLGGAVLNLLVSRAGKADSTSEFESSSLQAACVRVLSLKASNSWGNDPADSDGPTKSVERISELAQLAVQALIQADRGD